MKKDTSNGTISLYQGVEPCQSVCAKCAREIPQDAVYCPYCGKKLTREPQKRRRAKRANGTGSVYRLSGSRRRPWAARKDGIILGYYQTRKAAEEALAALIGRSLTPVYDYTFKEVFEAWKQTHFQDVQKCARGQYENSFSLFSELHDRRFRDLRTNDYQPILDERAETSAAATVQKDKNLLTQMSEWAVKNDIITTNYARYCKVRGRSASHHEPLTDEEVRLIQSDISETARVVCMLLATGCRINELFRLRLEDYHGTYVVTGSKTEAGRNRTIPIRPEGQPHFAYFAEKAADAGSDLLIGGYSGNKKPENFRKRDYYPLLDRLGIPRTKTPHSTRATYATRAVAEDLPPAVAQKVLGHADFDTTQKYYNNPDAETLVAAVSQAAEKAKREKKARRHKNT